MDDYDERLQFYNSFNRTMQETKNWCYKKMISLMFKYIDNPNKTEIKNSMILILNLFFIESPDNLHTKGKDIISLNENEKNLVLKIISKEVGG